MRLSSMPINEQRDDCDLVDWSSPKMRKLARDLRFSLSWRISDAFQAPVSSMRDGDAELSHLRATAWPVAEVAGRAPPAVLLSFILSAGNQNALWGIASRDHSDRRSAGR